MRVQFVTIRVAVEIAFRNLFANGRKTAIVCGIIGLGAMLVVVGSSVLDALDHSVRRSITRSVAGQIQVYSAASEDDLDIAPLGVEPKLAKLDDFAALRRTLLSVPNVAAVVPMGFGTGLLSLGTVLDQALSSLRTATELRFQHGDAPAAWIEPYQAQKAHVRELVRALREEVENNSRVSGPARSVSEIERASSEELWRDFDRDPWAHLEWLENQIAPLSAEPEPVALRYVGTDPGAFGRAFDHMYVVDGQAIPAGKRGFMFSKFVYEEQLKLKAARGLDKLAVGLDERHATIAADPELQRIVRENTRAARELLLQLDAAKRTRMRRELQQFLRSSETDLGSLLAAFLKTDDGNFHDRYRFFYATLAPMLELYRVKIGDSVTIQSSRGGYLRSANLKVYGTFGFQGLEKSPQAGAISMMDLVSFRELQDLDDSPHDELEALRSAAGVADVARGDAEQALFANKLEVGVQAADSAAIPALAELRGTRTRLKEAMLASYDPKLLEQGAVLNAAVLLKDEDALEPTVRAIARAGARDGLALKVVSWQQAAGMLGQLTTLLRAVLYAALVIIFLVALAVISNALMMATLARAREIGTLRALGAQRRFILGLLVIESVVIGVCAGSAGAVLGELLLLRLRATGIPAPNDAIAYVFSGARLFPGASFGDFARALATVVVVSVAAGIHPAWLGMHVSPREAMDAED